MKATARLSRAANRARLALALFVLFAAGLALFDALPVQPASARQTASTSTTASNSFAAAR